MKTLLRYIRKQRMLVLFALLAAVAASILSSLLPRIISRITEEIQKGLWGSMDMNAVMRYAAISVSFVALVFFLGCVQGRTMALVSARVTAVLRERLDGKLNRLPISYFDSNLNGTAVSVLTNDVDMLSEALAGSFVNILSNMVLMMGTLVMMLLTNFLLALTVIVSTLLGMFFASLFVRAGKPRFNNQQEELAALNGLIDEDLNGHIVIKAFHCEEAVCEAFEERSGSLYASAWRASFFSGLMSPLATFSGNLSYAAVCLLGAFLMIRGIGGADLPSIIAFIMYAKMFSTPLSQMSTSISKIQAGIAGAERVAAFLETKEMEHPAEILSDGEGGQTVPPAEATGNVVFDHVRFGYTEGAEILHDFSKQVALGQKIAIVGPTGAGKSTLVNLLMRYYELTGGRILLDGEDIVSMGRRELHERLGMVPQDTWVFEGSLRENIVFSTKDVSEERLKQVLEECGLKHFVDTLPEGVDTVISESSSLSQGQKQLVTIARAMIKNAPVLILDEATSAVDTRSELLIQNALDALTKGRTSFVIAHRLSTIRNADEIFVLKDGDIVETGRHADLLALGGTYATMYHAQFPKS